MKTAETMTMGDVLDALEKEIFSSTHINSFEKKCRDREVEIKRYINICGKILQQHVEKPNLGSHRLSHWRKEKSRECIKNLVDYTFELVNELNKDKIENYCKNDNHLFAALQKAAFEPDLILITLNSYYGVIVSDIYWITHITLHSAFEIAAGNYDLSELGKNTPKVISWIDDFINSNQELLSEYSNHLSTIREAFECYSNKHVKAFNLLLLTSIEGITRQLGKSLIEKQNLTVDIFSEKYNSLDSFLRKIPWKEDIPVHRSHLPMLTSNYKRINYNDPFTPIYLQPEIINVSFKMRLDFLRRRFKENRDIILHGQETEYDNPIHGFINSSALYEVLLTIKECHDVYNK